MEASASLVPQFLPLKSGRLFTVLHSPIGEARDEAILLLPPFAEELNKSRRQINAQARRFREAGYTVLIADLYGTGDSFGDFVEGNIERWQQNCVDLVEWLAAQGFRSLKLWAIRFGALLVNDLLERSPLPISQLILWQPLTSGTQAMAQFLRLQTASNMMKGAGGQSVADLQALLAQGESVEVAGYVLSSSLYLQSQALKLQDTEVNRGNVSVDWFQLVNNESMALPMPVTKASDLWRAQGAQVNTHKVVGDSFWATAELVLVESLIENTMSAVDAKYDSARELQA